MKPAISSARRAPKGVMTNKPIPVRLLPEERARIEMMAKREQRSLAAVCRLMLVQRLNEYETNPSSFLIS